MSQSICRASALALMVAMTAAPGPAFAGIDPAGIGTAPATTSAKSCSGAFRYAAREGNDDIVVLSAAHVFARDHRLARARFAGRAVTAEGFETSRWHTLTAMCGAR